MEGGSGTGPRGGRKGGGGGGDLWFEVCVDEVEPSVRWTDIWALDVAA